MHERNSNERNSNNGADSGGPRSPYQAPRIMSVESLEVLANNCAVGTGGAKSALGEQGCDTFLQS